MCPGEAEWRWEVCPGEAVSGGGKCAQVRL